MCMRETVCVCVCIKSEKVFVCVSERVCAYVGKIKTELVCVPVYVFIMSSPVALHHSERS